MAYDPTKYKQDSIDNWNSRARDYHDGWAGAGRGPFRSTKELVNAAGILESDFVLDVACGTGAVSREAFLRLGPSGMLVGIDFARGALKIAKENVQAGHFVEMDAENIGLRARFDRVLCQYALMFFPEPVRVLKELRLLLKEGGTIAVAVHGTAQGVPYFSTIMEPVLKCMPDIRPEGAPTVHRFGDPKDLENVLTAAGFAGVAVRKFVFDYEAGTFSEYWSDYMSTTAAAIRPKIEAGGLQIVAEIKKEAEEKAQCFVKNDGRIMFPWDVLVATATTTKS
ncbi:class I SAM-dependent methyltransferase [Nitrososphaera viennensis]|uniref:Class I SAM-dependent methyltransferase n=2 Tax=Nitrososphaera viennensis TaxID=1034015 RepID=A0A977IEI9_9ARCH|nr:class I SAM-dependent methyltransferase [Nitrososphaera viennensis]AIC14615.1 putative methyltransferase type 11 [Nitrososphaera viennensis EN76]UVS69579.1 class I SAM-dependent methyltransferase [Nitrososphaera viennensis]